MSIMNLVNVKQTTEKKQVCFLLNPSRRIVARMLARILSQKRQLNEAYVGVNQ